MRLFLLALMAPAPVWAASGEEDSPWTGAPVAEDAETADSPWDAPSPPPASEVASPWDEVPPSPWMKPGAVWMDLPTWWQATEPDPWGGPATAVPAPAPTGPAPADDGWGDDAADTAGWGAPSTEEPGWDDSGDDAGWGDSSDDAGWGESGDEAGWGDDSVGFADADTPTEPVKVKNPLFTFGGAIETRESLWVERLGTLPLASAKQSVDLETRFKNGIFRGRAAVHANVDFAYLPKREFWDEATTKTYGYQLLPREVWVSASPGDFEVALGRQTVAWGEGLLLSPLDVIAPRDMREPGLADLEDLRLPVTMAKLGWYPGSHRFELMWVPEFDHGFRSPPQGPYGFAEELVAQAPDLSPSDVFDDPTGGLLGGILDAFLDDQFDQYIEDLLASKTYTWDHQQPRWALSQSQLYGRWKYSGNGFDAGLYAATTLDKQGVIGFPQLQTFVQNDALALEVDHLRYTVLGHSGTAAVDKLLIRWELAMDLNKPFNVANFDVQPPSFGVGRGDLATVMVGTQLGYVPNTQIDVEISQGAFLRSPGEQFIPANTTNYALRVGWTGLREKLRLNATSLVFGTDARYGGLVRADASYALRDGLWATLGAISYRPGRENGPLLGLDTHDQLFGQVRWSF